MHSLMGEIRQATRSWSHHPLLATVAIVTLALAIAANVSIFALVRGILLRPSPYPAAERLVFVWNSYPGIGMPESTISVPDFIDRVTSVPEFEAATLFHVINLNLTRAGLPERVRGLKVTPSFFAVYGLPLAAGRPLDSGDASEGAEPVVVLAHEYHASRFGGDAELIGRLIDLHGVPHRVVGITRADFLPPFRDIQFYLPFTFTAVDRAETERGREFATMVARLAPGATLAAARESCRKLIRAHLASEPANREFLEAVGYDVVVRPYLDNLVTGVRPTLLLLQLGTILLLAVAGVNLAHLVLARTLGRGRELAVRAALGASRLRLARQFCAEGVVVAVPGTLAGLLLGSWGLGYLPELGLDRLPRLREVSLDGWVLAFTLGLGLLTTAAFTVVPLLAVPKRHLAHALQDVGSHSTAGPGTVWLRAAMVVTQVALAMTLLTGSLLLLRSFERLRKVDPGFSGSTLLTAGLHAPEVAYPDRTALAGLHARVLRELAALPAVTAVGLADYIPFGGAQASGTFLLPDRSPTGGPSASLHAHLRHVEGNFFTAMNLPILQGRSFGADDPIDGPLVCIVDEFFVHRHGRGRDLVGQRLQLGGDAQVTATIVGVVPTIRHDQLEQRVERETVYFHAGQRPPRAAILVVRTDGPGLQHLHSDLAEALYRVDPDLPLYDFRTLAERVETSLGPRRAPALLMTGFGLLALFLCALGVYGTLAHSVHLRRREIGIRLAMGASRRQIHRLVLRHGLRLTALGVILGCGLAALLAASWQDLLFEVSALDPVTFALAAAVVLSVSAFAAGWPARRATRIEPWIAMREE